jgi:WW domain
LRCHNNGPLRVSTMGKTTSEGLPAVRVVSSGQQHSSKESGALTKQQRHQQLLEFQTTLQQLKQARDTDALMLQNLRAELDILRRREFQEKKLEEDNDKLQLELLDAQQEILKLKQANAELLAQNELKEKQQELPSTAPLTDEEVNQEMHRIKNKCNKAIAKADKYKTKNQELEEKLRFYIVQKDTTDMVKASAAMQGLDPAQLQAEAIAARKERPRSGSRSRRNSPAKDEPQTTEAAPEPLNTDSALEPLPPIEEWEEYFDPDQQRLYYVNVTTGVSQWEKPLGDRQRKGAEEPRADGVPEFVNIGSDPQGQDIEWVPPVKEIRIAMPSEKDLFAGPYEEDDPAPRNPRRIPFPKITNKVHQWDDQVKAVRAKEEQAAYDAESESEKTSEPSLEPLPKPIVKMLGRGFFVQESPAEAWKRRKEAQQLKKENKYKPQKEKKSRIVFEKKNDWAANKLRNAPANHPDVSEFLRKFQQIGLHNENVIEATGKVEVKSGVMVTAKGVTYSGQAAIEKAQEVKRLRDEEERRLEEEEEAKWEKEEEERRQRELEEEEEENRRRDEEAQRVKEQREREIREKDEKAAKEKSEREAREKEEQDAKKKADEEKAAAAPPAAAPATPAAAPAPPAAAPAPPPPAAAPAPPAKKKSFLDSSSESDSPIIKKVAAPAAPAKKKKSFLDSSSDDSS